MKFILLISILLSSITINAYGANDVLWKTNETGYPINFYKDYVLFKNMDGITPIGFSLINLSNGEKVWNTKNDLSSIQTHSNDSIVVNNYVVIKDTTNKTVKCFELLSGKRVWSSEELFGYKLPYLIIGDKYYSYYNDIYPNDNQYGNLAEIDIQTGIIANQIPIQKLNNKGENIRILDCNSTYVIYLYNLKIWSYNLLTKKNVWYTYGTAISKVLLTNNYLIFSELDTDCAKSENYYITIVATSDWKTVYHFRGSQDFILNNNKLFYYKKQCEVEDTQAIEYINLYNGNLSKVLLEKDSSTDFFSSYKDSILIINGQDSKYLMLFDKDLNNSYKIQLSCSGHQYMIHKDYLIMKRFYDDCKSQGDFTYICYPLPGYKPPEINPPFNFIKWILRFIFGKLTLQP